MLVLSLFLTSFYRICKNCYLTAKEIRKYVDFRCQNVFFSLNVSCKFLSFVKLLFSVARLGNDSL